MRTLVYAEDYNSYLRVCKQYSLPHTNAPRQVQDSTAIWCRSLDSIRNKPKSWVIYAVVPTHPVRAQVLRAALAEREVTYVGSMGHSSRRQGEL